MTDSDLRMVAAIVAIRAVAVGAGLGFVVGMVVGFLAGVR